MDANTSRGAKRKGARTRRREGLIASRYSIARSAASVISVARKVVSHRGHGGHREFDVASCWLATKDTAGTKYKAR
jgi:hypothetical protein